MSIVEVPSYNLLGKLDDLAGGDHVSERLQQVEEVVGLLAVELGELCLVDLLAAQLDLLVGGFLHVDEDEGEREAERNEPEEPRPLAVVLLVAVDELDRCEHVQVVVNPVREEKEAREHVQRQLVRLLRSER